MRKSPVEFLQGLQYSIVKSSLRRRDFMKKVINELAVATATVVTSIAIAVAAHYVVAILDLFV